MDQKEKQPFNEEKNLFAHLNFYSCWPASPHCLPFEIYSKRCCFSTPNTAMCVAKHASASIQLQTHWRPMTQRGNRCMNVLRFQPEGDVKGGWGTGRGQGETQSSCQQSSSHPDSFQVIIRRLEVVTCVCTRLIIFYGWWQNSLQSGIKQYNHKEV